MPLFKIFNVTRGKILNEAFENGKDAAERCVYYASRYGMKYQPRAVNDENWWKRVERDIQDGKIVPINWYNILGTTSQAYQLHYKYSQAVTETIRRTYPRPSPKPSMLDYYESEEKGARGILTTTTPGRYLTQYFSNVLSKEEIRDMATAYEAYYAHPDLKFATTEEEIEAVFRYGPSSCMKRQDHPADKTHPARVYAGGDLQIAYLGSIEDKRITARSAVWPAKMVHASAYGDTVRLTKALKEAGYTDYHTYEGTGPFAGARLKKIVEDDKYVGGHLDYFPFFRDMGDYLQVVTKQDKPDGGFTTAGLYAVKVSDRWENETAVKAKPFCPAAAAAA